jgi:hypothetical protein
MLAERKLNTNLNGKQETPTGQPNNPSGVKYPYATSIFILVASLARSVHGRADVTGSVQDRPIRCNSDMDQLEKHLAVPQKSVTSADLSAKTSQFHESAAK